MSVKDGLLYLSLEFEFVVSDRGGNGSKSNGHGGGVKSNRGISISGLVGFGILWASGNGELEGFGVLGISEEDGVVGSWITVVVRGNIAPGLSAPVLAVVSSTFS